MNKHLQLKDILPYYDSDSERIQVTTKVWDRYDEFHAQSPLLKEFSDWVVLDMGCIAEDVLRVFIRKIEEEEE